MCNAAAKELSPPHTTRQQQAQRLSESRTTASSCHTKKNRSRAALAEYMSTAAPQPSPRVTPDKGPMAGNKKIYVLDCGGQYCHLIASRLRRHEALSVIVPRAAASRSKRRVCAMARRRHRF